MVAPAKQYMCDERSLIALAEDDICWSAFERSTCEYLSNSLDHGIAPLGGSWDLVSKVIRTLIGVISRVTLTITRVTKSHDPLSTI